MILNYPFVCAACATQAVNVVELSDTGYYELQCKNGHTTTFILTQQPFELLYEIGIAAIHDGYFREAISSFASSLERFHEFYVKVIADRHGVGSNNINATWKRVSNLSERQVGAFIFTYLYEKKVMPKLLPDDLVKLRNDTIHKGKLPKRKDAIEYGQAVLEIIDPIIYDLRSNYFKETNLFLDRYIKNVNINYSEKNTKAKAKSQGKHVEAQNCEISSTVAIPTFVSLSRNVLEKRYVEDAVSNYGVMIENRIVNHSRINDRKKDS